MRQSENGSGMTIATTGDGEMNESETTEADGQSWAEDLATDHMRRLESLAGMLPSTYDRHVLGWACRALRKQAARSEKPDSQWLREYVAIGLQAGLSGAGAYEQAREALTLIGMGEPAPSTPRTPKV